MVIHLGIPAAMVFLVILESLKVLRILRSIGLSPYKISLTQQLLPADKPLRMQFANWMKTNESLIGDVLRTYEAYFSLVGMVNRHNL